MAMVSEGRNSGEFGGDEMEQSDQLRRNWTVTGTAQSNGGHFDKVSIRGEAKVTGGIDCGQLKVMGTLSVVGNLTMKTSKVMGTLGVTGDVSGEDIKVMGEMNVKGNCNAESYQSRGAFDIDGLLNAGTVKIILHGHSRVKEIGGDTICVKPNFTLFSSGFRQLTVDTVEGDDIDLQYTSARVVRGNRVKIGPGCEIESVEYTTDLRLDDDAKVSQQAKR